MKLEQSENQDFELKLLCELHEGLERQGPGSAETTLKALGFLDGLPKNARVSDLGCGTGGQTMVLARHISGSITGIDLFPAFISRLNENAKKLGLDGRVSGMVGSMDDLPFQNEELDLIWSEGAIDNIGFAKGLNDWRRFLKKNGYVAVTCPSWFTQERPAEIERFWREAGSELDSIGDNLSVMQKAGYAPVAAFTLPDTCWLDHYFIPREKAGKALLQKYSGNKTAESFMADMRHEVELYLRYKEFYGYAFYIGKRRR